MISVFTVAIVLVFLTAWASLIYVVPWCMTSLLRDSLWQLRDETVDEIRARRLGDSHQARQLLDFIEAAIYAAPKFTYLNVWVLNRLARNLRSEREWLDLTGLPANDRRVIAQRHYKALGLLRRHLLLGSPTGWVVTILYFVPVVLFLVALELPAAFRDARVGRREHRDRERTSRFDRWKRELDRRAESRIRPRVRPKIPRIEPALVRAAGSR